MGIERKIANFLKDEGIDIIFDSKTHYFSINTDTFVSPKLHPVTAFRLLKEYYPDWTTFVRDFPEVKLKMPVLRVEGQDITDAFFILFGGRKGLDDAKLYILRLLKKKYEKTGIITGEIEDDMIEHCWDMLDLKKDVRKIITFLKKKNYYSEILQICLSYIKNRL